MNIKELEEKIAKLESDKEKIEKNIGNPHLVAQKSHLQKTLETIEKRLKEAKEELKEAEKKPEPTAKKKPGKKKEEPKAKKPKVTKEKKEQVNEEPETITVDGKKYSLDECESAIAAIKAKKKQSAKSSEKSEAKAPSIKAAEGLERTVARTLEAIPKTTLSKHTPAKIKKSVNDFEHKLSSAFRALEEIGLPITFIKKIETMLKKEVKDWFGEQDSK